uniref:Uncharacterized protein n=1 Tax=Rhizophora mucronata TaxID=61149 RepID=A0A2P2IT86_RHIMU
MIGLAICLIYFSVIQPSLSTYTASSIFLLQEGNKKGKLRSTL